jgi:hypothetical protein
MRDTTAKSNGGHGRIPTALVKKLVKARNSENEQKKRSAFETCS